MAEYRNLDVWQLGRSIVTTAYRFTELLPEAETNGLIQQIKSSAVAVPAAIADGAGRANDVQYLRLIQDALGAISKLDTLVMLAADLEYVEEFHTHDIEKRTKELSMKLRALASKLESDAFGVRRRQFDGPPRHRREEGAEGEGEQGSSEEGSSEDRPRRSYRQEESGDDRPPRRSYRDSGGSDDRPRRSYGDRPTGGSDDRPRRSYGDRPAGGSDDRPRRSYGDRPAGGGGGFRGGGGGRPGGGYGGGDRPPRRPRD